MANHYRLKSIPVGLSYFIFFPGYPFFGCCWREDAKAVMLCTTRCLLSLYEVWLHCTLSRCLNNMHETRRAPAPQLSSVFLLGFRIMFTLHFFLGININYICFLQAEESLKEKGEVYFHSRLL